MTEELQQKIDASIALIRKGEKLALLMQPEYGYHVGFSGGKDSQAVLELVKMAGVKYRAVYNVTTNDPPENVYFIRRNYPDVQFSHPETTFLRIVEENGMPIRTTRFCCRFLKERSGVGFATITGVRHFESRNRGRYQAVTKIRNRKYEAKSLDEMENARFECIGGKDKIMVYPILEWTEQDVWDFIDLRGLPHNPCYSTVKRVGCMFCPFAGKRQLRQYRERYPKFHAAILRSLQRYIDTHDTDFCTAAECYDWWESKLSVEVYKAKKMQTQINFDL